MSIPTTKTSMAAVWKCKLYIQNNDGNQIRGTSHQHVIDCYADVPGASTGNATTTKPSIADIIAAYQSVIGLGTKIIWANITVSKVRPGVSYAALAAPVGPVARASESPIGSINAAGDAITFRLETAGGQKSSHEVEFVRDAEIVDQTFQVDVSAFTPNPSNIPSPWTGLTALESWSGFMQVLLSKTMLASYRNGVYVCQPWASIFMRGVTTRRIGPGFFGSRRKLRV